MSEESGQAGFLERHWAWVVGVTSAFGLAVIALAFVANPWLVERYVSSDHELDAGTWRRVLISDAVLLLIGLAVVFTAWRNRAFSERRRKKVIGATFAAGSCLMGLVALELGLRFVHHYVRPLPKQRHFFFQYDETLGWRHRPDTTCTFKGCRVALNSHGLRDEEIAYGKRTDTYRVLFLGDSQLFGDGVGQGETFVDLLEDDLENVQTINAGVIGYGTDQQQLFFVDEGKRYRPDLTVVALNAYDLHDNVSSQVRSGYRKPVYELSDGKLRLTNVPVPRQDLATRFDRRFREISHLYDEVRRRLHGIGKDDEQNAGGQIRAADVFPSGEQYDTALDVTCRILALLADDCRAAGGRLAVVFLPYQMDFSADEEYRGRADRLVAALSAWGESEDVRVVDLRQSLREFDPAELYLDTMHFSPEGHRRVAEALEVILPRSDGAVSRRSD